MTKTFKSILFSIGSLASISTVMVSVVSCAADPNSAIKPRDGGKNAYTIYLKNGKTKTETFADFMAYLKDHPGANTSAQIQYDNQVIKWLYKDEQYSSVKAHQKDFSVAELTTYDDVFKNAKKKLEDAKKAIKTQYGVNWEPEWAKSLLSSQYGQALSEDQAIEYLAVQTMKPDALKRFTLKIDSTTYKASDIGDGNHSFLQGGSPTGTPPTIGTKNINAIASNDTSKPIIPAIALISNSYNDNYKSPDTLLKTYMAKYKTALNIRHVLYALKAGKTTDDPWTLTTDSITKLYGNINNGPISSNPLAWQNLYKLESGDSNMTAKTNWASNPIAGSSAIQGSLVGQILSNYSDNAGAAKTYGALGMTSLYDDVKTLVPGFAIPIAVSNSSAIASKITPKAVNFNMDDALGATNHWNGKEASLDPNITNEIKTVLGDATELQKVLVQLKTQFSTSGTRSLEYAINSGTALANPTQAVFSSDGLHMIYQEKIANDPAQADGGLNTWMYNDLIKTRDGDPLIYNIIKEVNAKLAPTDNFANIYPLINAEPKSDYPGAQTFNDFVKSQKNYEHPGNPKFTDADITDATDLANILVTTKKETDILTLQKKYQTWWDANVLTNKLVDPGTLQWSDINKMIAELGKDN